MFIDVHSSLGPNTPPTANIISFNFSNIIKIYLSFGLDVKVVFVQI